MLTHMNLPHDASFPPVAWLAPLNAVGFLFDGAIDCCDPGTALSVSCASIQCVPARAGPDVRQQVLLPTSTTNETLTRARAELTGHSHFGGNSDKSAHVHLQALQMPQKVSFFLFRCFVHRKLLPA